MRSQRKQSRKPKFSQLKEGDIIAIIWKDITQHDHIKAAHLRKGKFRRYITTIKPTVTYGRFCGMENQCIIVAQEYCEDTVVDASMIEVIPIGCITGVVVLKLKKVIAGPML